MRKKPIVSEEHKGGLAGEREKVEDWLKKMILISDKEVMSMFNLQFSPFNELVTL